MIRAFVVSVIAAVTFASPALAKGKVIFLCSHFADPFKKSLRDSVVTAAEAYPHLELDIKDAGKNSTVQIEQFKAALAAKPEAIIFLGVDEAANKFAAAASAKAKVPLIFYNRLPPFERFDGEVSIVASNDLVAGRMQMRVLADKIGNKGNVVVLRGKDEDPASRTRLVGVQEILAVNPDLNLVKEASANWHRDEAEKLVLGWLDSGVKIDAIAALNDEMAIGAIDALKKRGYPPGAIPVGGVDGTKLARDEMRAGYLAVTVLQNAKAQGVRVMDDAARFARDEPAPQYDWVLYELIVPSNLAKYD